MKATFLVALIFRLLEACGQSGYNAGTVFLPAGDSVNGFLSFSAKIQTPTPCLFKLQKTAEPATYAAGAITAFRLDNGGYFVSRAIGRSEDVFLEVLVKGHMSLYKFGSIYFIEKKDSAFFELSDEMEVLLVEGERMKKKSRNFTRMLALLMTDCVEASKQVPSVKLKEKPLVKLVGSYNTCMGSPIFYYRVKIRP